MAGASFGATTDQGLRTLAGGQMSIQVEGYLAMQTDAAPPLVVDEALAARDIFAVVNQAPSGGAVTLQLRQGSTVWCSLTIADGATMSNVVDGFGLPALAAEAQVLLDIFRCADGVGDAAGSGFDGDDKTCRPNDTLAEPDRDDTLGAIESRLKCRTMLCKS